MAGNSLLEELPQADAQCLADHRHHIQRWNCFSMLPFLHRMYRYITAKSKLDYGHLLPESIVANSMIAHHREIRNLVGTCSRLSAVCPSLAWRHTKKVLIGQAQCRTQEGHLQQIGQTAPALPLLDTGHRQRQKRRKFFLRKTLPFSLLCNDLSVIHSRTPQCAF